MSQELSHLLDGLYALSRLSRGVRGEPEGLSPLGRGFSRADQHVSRRREALADLLDGGLSRGLSGLNGLSRGERERGVPLDRCSFLQALEADLEVGVVAGEADAGLGLDAGDLCIGSLIELVEAGAVEAGLVLAVPHYGVDLGLLLGRERGGVAHGEEGEARDGLADEDDERSGDGLAEVVGEDAVEDEEGADHEGDDPSGDGGVPAAEAAVFGPHDGDPADVSGEGDGEAEPAAVDEVGDGVAGPDEGEAGEGVGAVQDRGRAELGGAHRALPCCLSISARTRPAVA